MNAAQSWRAYAAPIRLRDGYHLYAAPGDVWLLFTPDEQFVRLHVAPDQLVALHPVLSGARPPQALLAEAPGADALCQILDEFARHDLITPASSPEPDLSGRHVVLRGANPVADQIARLLPAAGVGVVDMQDTAAPFAPADLIIACAGWLPDRSWLALDAWCRERAVAWHRCHAEGTRFAIGPITIPGRTADYADTRARRLAAAPFPHELQAYWQSLESGYDLPPVPWPDVGAAAMIAGALVADTLAYLAGTPVPSEGEQLVFDPQHLAWCRHPVLPVPHRLPLSGERRRHEYACL